MATDLIPLHTFRYGTWTLVSVSAPSLRTRDPSGLSGARGTCWSVPRRTTQYATPAQQAGRTHAHLASGGLLPPLQAILWNIRHCRFQRQLLGHKGAVFAADLDSRAALSCTASGDKVRVYLKALSSAHTHNAAVSRLSSASPTTDHCHLECSNRTEAADPASQSH